MVTKMMYFAISLNKKALPQAFVTLSSISVNHIGEELKVYVLHSELSQEDRDFLALSLSEHSNEHLIEFIYVDPNLIPQLPCNSFWSVEAYYRLLFVDLLPNDIDRILYLDIDMIVNKNIRGFYETDFEGKHLVVSEDMEFHNILELKSENEIKHASLFKPLMEEGLVYFCSGMMLYNLRVLRKEKIDFAYYMKVFSEMSEYFILFDQDLLNYVHWKNVKFVDNRIYGIFAPTAHTLGYSYEEVKETAAIIHFTGAAKPWTVNLLRYDIEKIWWEYAKTAPFYYQLMEQVFFDSMESTLTENFIKTQTEENNSLKNIVYQLEALMKKMQGM